MSLYKIAVVGDKDSILGFKAVGVQTFPVTGPEQAEQVLRRLARERYGVVFLTEPLAGPLQELLQELNTRLLPSVVLIPNNAGSTGFAMSQIKRNVEKAVGADILFGKEGE